MIVYSPITQLSAKKSDLSLYLNFLELTVILIDSKQQN